MLSLAHLRPSAGSSSATSILAPIGLFSAYSHAHPVPDEGSVWGPSEEAVRVATGRCVADYAA